MRERTSSERLERDDDEEEQEEEGSAELFKIATTGSSQAMAGVDGLSRCSFATQYLVTEAALQDDVMFVGSLDNNMCCPSLCLSGTVSSRCHLF